MLQISCQILAFANDFWDAIYQHWTPLLSEMNALSINEALKEGVDIGVPATVVLESMFA